MEKEVKRGYVKWTDENGFHKEPLVDHPELLSKASPEEQVAAEEVRRLNAAAEEFYADSQDDAEQDAKDTLKALKAAPEDVLTAAQLVDEDEAVAPMSAPEDTGEKTPEVETLQEPANTDHEATLAKLREDTSE